MTTAFILPLRAVQAVFSIVVLGLTAYIVDWYNGPWEGGWSPDSVDFMLFTSIWTLLAVAYLVFTPTRYPSLAHKYAICAVEAVTMIFWFAAWVAVAARWGDSYWHPLKNTTPWSSGVAAIVFGALIWLTFVFTTVMSALHIRRTPRGDTSAPPQMQGV